MKNCNKPTQKKKNFLKKKKKKKIDGCLIGNPCGSGTCVATGSTIHNCECPTGYDNDNSCNGIVFFFFLPFLFFPFSTDFISNRYQ